jgi:hypothetical protein
MDVFAQGDWYSLVAAITMKDYIAAHAVPGSFDAFEFHNFIAKQVVSISIWDIISFRLLPFM